jgi:GxxExxY protein
MDIYNFRERAGSGVPDEIENLAVTCIGAAIDVHRELGAGIPELCCRNALSHELKLRSVPHEVEAVVPVYYKGVWVGEGKVDILVAQKLVLELKVVETLTDAHRAQVISYLAALKLPLGLLINFNVTVLRDGLKRVIRTT